MRQVTLFAGIAVIGLFIVTGVLAQARPDFSGTWTLDPSSAPLTLTGERASGPFGMEFTANQDGKSLTITRTVGAPLLTETFNLDGAESRNHVPGPNPVDWVSKVTCEGSRLVIASELRFPGNTIESRRVLWIERGDLVVETTSPSPLSDQANTTRVVYKKS